MKKVEPKKGGARYVLGDEYDRYWNALRRAELSVKVLLENFNGDKFSLETSLYFTESAYSAARDILMIHQGLTKDKE